MKQQQLPFMDVNRWFPSSYYRGPNIMVWLAILACFTTAFIKIWTPTSLNRWPEAITTLLFIYPLVKQWRFFKKQPLIILMLLAIAAPLLFFAINYVIDAEKATQYALFEVLSRIYLFIPIAWWLGGNLKTILLFLLTALLGFFFACSQDPNLVRSIQYIFKGLRVDFGILNAQHVALFFSLGLIGCLSFFPMSLKTKPLALRLTLSIALFVLIVVCVIGLIGTQTRAAYLALFLAVLFLVSSFLISFAKNKDSKVQKRKITSVVLLLLVIGLGTYSTQKNAFQTITKRITGENATLKAIIKRDWANIPYSSLGVRVNTWIVALEKIAEKPLIGHGGKVRQDVIQQSDRLPEHIKRNFGHFHNSYLEFALGYGVIGLALALAPFMIIIAYANLLNSPVSYFTVYGLLIFAAMNFFESYLFFWMGPFLCTLLCGPLLSLWFSTTLQNTELAYE